MIDWQSVMFLGAQAVGVSGLWDAVYKLARFRGRGRDAFDSDLNRYRHEWSYIEE